MSYPENCDTHCGQKVLQLPIADDTALVEEGIEFEYQVQISG